MKESDKALEELLKGNLDFPEMALTVKECDRLNAQLRKALAHKDKEHREEILLYAKRAYRTGQKKTAFWAKCLEQLSKGKSTDD